MILLVIFKYRDINYYYLTSAHYQTVPNISVTKTLVLCIKLI